MVEVVSRIGPEFGTPFKGLPFSRNLHQIKLEDQLQYYMNSKIRNL